MSVPHSPDRGPRRILALETSTRVASVALVLGDRVVGRERGPEGAHSADLLTLVEEALAEADLSLAEVDALAVGAGPGSFTGLRIALATAKGLALATGKPLLAVSSLAALARDAADAAAAQGARVVVPVLDARRGELYAGVYRIEPGHPARPQVTALVADQVIGPSGLALVLAALGLAPADVALVGDACAEAAAAGAGRPLAGARATPSAASVAALAAEGHGHDARLSGPTYLRPAEAEAKADALASAPGPGHDLDVSAPTPEMIERFRQIGLRLDRAGRLWQRDEEITHAGLRRAILRWLDVRAEDGRPIVRLDQQRYAYIEVEDAHLRAVSLRWDGDRPIVVLDDGSEEPLDPAGLSVGADGAVFGRARGGRLIVRLSTAAQQHLAEHLVPKDGGTALRALGRDWPLDTP